MRQSVDHDQRICGVYLRVAPQDHSGPFFQPCRLKALQGRFFAGPLIGHGATGSLSGAYVVYSPGSPRYCIQAAHGWAAALGGAAEGSPGLSRGPVHGAAQHIQC